LSHWALNSWGCYSLFLWSHFQSHYHFHLQFLRGAGQAVTLDVPGTLHYSTL
jgi:hypothetical protein